MVDGVVEMPVGIPETCTDTWEAEPSLVETETAMVEELPTGAVKLGGLHDRLKSGPGEDDGPLPAPPAPQDMVLKTRLRSKRLHILLVVEGGSAAMARRVRKNRASLLSTSSRVP